LAARSWAALRRSDSLRSWSSWGALLDTLLELGGIALQLVLLVLDAAEHLVEGIGQRAQLVRADLGGLPGVVLPRGNGFGGLLQRQNGLRNRTLEDHEQGVRRQ